MSTEKRRFPRYNVLLPVRLKYRVSSVEMVTGDVSRHGAFLRTDSPAPERQLVQLIFSMPGGRFVEVMGMVTRVIRPEDSAPSGPGMGVDFFALSASAKNAWSEFVHHLREQALDDDPTTVEKNIEVTQPAPETADLKLSKATGTGLAGTGLLVDDELRQLPGISDLFDEIPEAAVIPAERDGELHPPLGNAEHSAPPATPPIRRKSPRYVASFLVRLKDKQRLKKFYTRDVSAGGMFLKTPLLKNVGDSVQVILIHPETDLEFHLDGIVVRVERADSQDNRGMGIQFQGLAGQRARALARFVETGAEALEVTPPQEEQRIRDLELAVEVAPDSPRAHEELAAALGDSEQAQHHLDEARRLRAELFENSEEPED